MAIKGNSHAKDFKFSMVMPVYNVEEYLAEAIDSITAQTIGFSENVQIILVNDGSTDNSDEICKKYATRYPSNIVYVKQKNKGVSEARNIGLKRCEGQYVGFVDSDDKISADTLESVYNFFIKNDGETDVISIKIELFGAAQGSHISNGKFHNGTRLIDLKRDWWCRQTTIGNVFIAAPVAKRHKFNKALKTNEDTLYLAEIISDKLTLGVVVEPTYYYRKRFDATSAVDMSNMRKEWFTSELATLMDGLLEQLELKATSKYTQHIACYFLAWRLKDPKRPIAITSDELEEYKAKIATYLHSIDDDVICGVPNITVEHKLYMLSLKRGRDIKKELKLNKDGDYTFESHVLYSRRSVKFYIDFVEFEPGGMRIEGWHTGFRIDDLEFVAMKGDKEIPLELVANRASMDSHSLGDVIYTRNAFAVSIDFKQGEEFSVQFGYRYKEGRIAGGVVPKRFTRLSDDVHNTYSVNKKFSTITTLINKNALYVQPLSLLALAKKELRLLSEITKKYGIRKSFRRLGYGAAKLVLSPFKVWLVSDRQNTAGDNAEHLFRYLVDNKKKRFVFFAIDKDTPAYKELKKYSKRTIVYNSLLYRILFLASDKRISSHFDVYITDAFGSDRAYVANFHTFDYIYLEHGVLASDSSKQYDRYAKNMRLLTLASDYEKAGILHIPEYQYDKQLVVTGHPRMDALLDSGKPENVIMVAPTWRLSLAGKVEIKNGIESGKRMYNRDFKNSSYYQFYNNLINDPKILKKLSEKDYRIEFYIHPSLAEQWTDFHSDAETIKVMKPPHDYVSALRKSAIMITDYSGVAFDFAYQDKPVVYTQFDKELLYDQHYYGKNDFDYEVHGFGPVAYDYEAAVENICEQIEAGAAMEKKYKDRAREFFNVRDGKSAERIVEEIRKVDELKR